MTGNIKIEFLLLRSLVLASSTSITFRDGAFTATTAQPEDSFTLSADSPNIAESCLVAKIFTKSKSTKIDVLGR